MSLFLPALCAVVALGGAPAFAAGKVEATVFGPATFFDIGNGAKQSKNFTILNTGLPFTLRFQNNGADHAQIKLNGKLIQSNGLIKDPKFATTFSVTLAASNEVEVKVMGPGSQSSITLSITAVTGELPPDPVTVAPPVDPSVPTTVANSTSFLYTGSNPIQKGVAAGTIAPTLAAVIHGKVLNPAGQPLAGVTVTVQDHPEYGSTATRSTGEYDLGVNGGSPHTLNFRLPGFIQSSRSGLPLVGRYFTFENLTLVPLDQNVGHLNFGPGATTVQTVRGSQINDSQGSRRITVLVPPATGASLIMPNGSQQSVTELSVRATDYTAVADGISSLPTKATEDFPNLFSFELSADEAIALGAASVQFSQPIYQYVENFLSLPTGTLIR